MQNLVVGIVSLSRFKRKSKVKHYFSESQGSRAIFILSEFDRSHSSEYKLYCSATPLMQVHTKLVKCMIPVRVCMSVG